MARPRKVDRTVDIHLLLPETLIAEVELLLYSDIEARVPHGARSKFFTTAAQQYLTALKDQACTQKQ